MLMFNACGDENIDDSESARLETYSFPHYYILKSSYTLDSYHPRRWSIFMRSSKSLRKITISEMIRFEKTAFFNVKSKPKMSYGNYNFSLTSTMTY